LRNKASVEARNHRQIGNPALLARALIVLAEEAKPPLRYVPESDVVEKVRAKLKDVGDEMSRVEHPNITGSLPVTFTLILFLSCAR
jgi:hypothetical protein